MFKRIGCCFFPLVFFSSLSFASLMTPADVDLGGGRVGPKDELFLPLSGLIPGVRYSIDCLLINPNFENNGVIFSVSPGVGQFGDIVFNDNYYHGGSLQSKLWKLENNLEIRDVYYSYGSIRFINADKDDYLEIKNCKAFVSYELSQ